MAMNMRGGSMERVGLRHQAGHRIQPRNVLRTATPKNRKERRAMKAEGMTPIPGSTAWKGAPGCQCQECLT